MENLINWLEIPAMDFNRAVSFYKTILGLEIKETEMFGTKMGFFPTDGTNVSGAIVQGEDYKASTDGVLAYLNGGNDLQNVLDKVEKCNGIVIVPKTQISPEMGYFAIFIDTEGNKMAVHSIN
ncbi:VOC family protein [Pedobacter frigiditerrae]|uniref:VOC family protein n=1 Tax=Pedobacter frigiditerrae TaxID=2530452 RepID=UPI00292E7247|nr:VOC family protein [Pedobacter frigiditerrae]